jgi:hypothetical protein
VKVWKKVNSVKQESTSPPYPLSLLPIFAGYTNERDLAALEKDYEEVAESSEPPAEEEY